MALFNIQYCRTHFENFTMTNQPLCFFLKNLSFLLLLLLTNRGLSQTAFCAPGTMGFEECEQVNCTMCDINNYLGTTAGYGPDPDNDIFTISQFCGSNTSIQYIQFSAAANPLTISVGLVGCTPITGVDLAVMPECDTQVIGCSAGNGSGSNSLTLSNLTIGNTYILIINVNATSDCDFRITVSPPNGTVPTNATIPPNFTITGDNMVCPGAGVMYQVNPQTFIATYTWTGPNGSEINGVPQPSPVMTNLPQAFVTWGNTGGNLCVTAENDCSLPVTVCQPVTVTKIPHTVFPTLTVCSEDVPAILDWGEEAYNSGVHTMTIPSFEGCDSTLEQSLIILPTKTTYLPPAVMCAGDCMTVCGENYCDYGDYSVICKTFQGCDSTINFSIVPPNIVADISRDGKLTCVNHSVTLTAAPSTGLKTWHDSNGNSLGIGNFITVSTPGLYYLDVAQTVNGHTCTVTDTITVPLDIAKPPLMVSGAAVDCDTTTARIHASTPANPAMYDWTGPNGFMSNLPNPVVTAPGVYHITVTDLDNGCITKDSVVVTRCCQTSSGSLDTALVFVCGANLLLATYHFDEVLENADSLFFVLCTNPADPLGTALMTSATPGFPFMAGVQQFDTIYFVSAVAAPVNGGNSIDFSSACLSVSPAQPVMWAAKPSISLNAAPSALCRDGGCLDVTFQFTGVPPFQFHYDIYQNGQLQFAADETSATTAKTITVCSDQFNQPLGLQDLNFLVNFLQDARCNCTN